MMLPASLPQSSPGGDASSLGEGAFWPVSLLRYETSDKETVKQRQRPKGSSSGGAGSARARRLREFSLGEGAFWLVSLLRYETSDKETVKLCQRPKGSSSGGAGSALARRLREFSLGEGALWSRSLLQLPPCLNGMGLRQIFDFCRSPFDYPMYAMVRNSPSRLSDGWYNVPSRKASSSVM